jgi:Ca2+-transporting ATPase
MASVATACGLPSPLNAMQILWINIIMDGPPAQSLGVEPVDEHILRAKPRRSEDPIVTRNLLFRAISSAAIIVFLTLKVFANELDDGKTSRRDTTMTFMTFVNCDLFNAYVCRSADRCFHEINFFGNTAFLWAIGGSIVGQLMVIYFPPLQEVFQTEALSRYDLFYIILLSSSILWFDTLRKKFFSHWFSDGFNPSPRAKKEDDPAMPPRTTSWLNFRQLQDDKSAYSARAVSRRGRKANTSLAL